MTEVGSGTQLMRAPSAHTGQTMVMRSALPNPADWQNLWNMALEMFQDDKRAAMMREMGFSSAAVVVQIGLKALALQVDLGSALEGIKSFQGKLCPTGRFLRFLGRRAGGRCIEVKDGRDGHAEWMATRPGYPPVLGVFTKEDAKTAGLMNKDTYQKYLPDMLSARALSRACWKQFADLYYGPDDVPLTNEVADDDAIDDHTVITVASDVSQNVSTETSTVSSSAPPAASARRSTRQTKAADKPAADGAPKVVDAPTSADSKPATEAASSPETPSSGVAPQSAATPPTSGETSAPTADPSDDPSGGAPSNADAPEDGPLPFTKGQYVGRTLSSLGEEEFRLFIPQFAKYVNNPDMPADRRVHNRQWLEKIQRWAAYRGVTVEM